MFLENHLLVTLIKSILEQLDSVLHMLPPVVEIATDFCFCEHHSTISLLIIKVYLDMDRFVVEFPA